MQRDNRDQHTSCRVLQQCALIIFLLLLFMLVGCTQANLPPAPATDWTTRWLQGGMCQAPCWEGITPGQTTVPDGVMILQNNPWIQSVTVITDTIDPTWGEVTWIWKDGMSGGRAFFDAQQPPYTISRIQVNYPVSYTLRDVIVAYGYPSHIIATAHQGGFLGESDPNQLTYSLHVVYQQQHFMLGIETNDQRPVMSEDLRGATPFFFAKSDALGIRPPAELVPWQGFQSFEFYCRDEQQGHVCRAVPTPPIAQWFGLFGFVLIGSLLYWQQRRRQRLKHQG